MLFGHEELQCHGNQIMPTFFDQNNLTDFQKSKWDSAIEQYKLVQEGNLDHKFASLTEDDRANYAKNGQVTDIQIKSEMRLISGLLAGGNGNCKSALFARLLEGKSPLEFAPPCSFSYPWYSVIEDAGPWQICDVADSKLISEMSSVGKSGSNERDDRHVRILINQTFWELVSQTSPTEAVVTFRLWSGLGYKWRLARELMSTVDASGFICAWHDKTLGRITTLDQLNKEQTWHVAERFSMLKYALDDVLAEDHIKSEKLKSGFQGACASGQVEAARTLLQSRRDLSLTDYPTEQEISIEATKLANKYLDRNYFADPSGNLFVWVWNLHRISPN